MAEDLKPKNGGLDPDEDDPSAPELPEGTEAPDPETAPEPDERISVVVHAPDPISREGTISQLRQHPVVDLINESEAQRHGVAVLLAESLDPTILASLRRLVRSEGLPARYGRSWWINSERRLCAIASESVQRPGLYGQ